MNYLIFPSSIIFRYIHKQLLALMNERKEKTRRVWPEKGQDLRRFTFVSHLLAGQTEAERHWILVFCYHWLGQRDRRAQPFSETSACPYLQWWCWTSQRDVKAFSSSHYQLNIVILWVCIFDGFCFIKSTEKWRFSQSYHMNCFPLLSSLLIRRSSDALMSDPCKFWRQGLFI